MTDLALTAREHPRPRYRPRRERSGHARAGRLIPVRRQSPRGLRWVAASLRARVGAAPAMGTGPAGRVTRPATGRAPAAAGQQSGHLARRGPCPPPGRAQSARPPPAPSRRLAPTAAPRRRAAATTPVAIGAAIPSFQPSQEDTSHEYRHHRHRCPDRQRHRRARRARGCGGVVRAHPRHPAARQPQRRPTRPPWSRWPPPSARSRVLQALTVVSPVPAGFLDATPAGRPSGEVDEVGQRPPQFVIYAGRRSRDGARLAGRIVIAQALGHDITAGPARADLEADSRSRSVVGVVVRRWYPCSLASRLSRRQPPERRTNRK